LYRPEDTNVTKIESWTGRLNTPTRNPAIDVFLRGACRSHAAVSPPTKAPTALPPGNSTMSRMTPTIPATSKPATTDVPIPILLADMLCTTRQESTGLVGPPNKPSLDQIGRRYLAHIDGDSRP